MNILALSGSLRAHSYNTKLIEIARDVSDHDTTITVWPLHDLPLFNEDLESGEGPESVRRFKAAILGADALLIATPEYNSSIPGVLKNALDWASRRESGTRPLSNIPVAVMGATTGTLGTALAQKHLRQILSHVGAQVLTTPSVYVMNAGNVLQSESEHYPAVVERIGRLVQALVHWTNRLEGTRT